MKTQLRLLLLPLILSSLVSLVSACSKPAEHATTATTARGEKPPAKYPLRGVIIDVQADKSSLLVKHEDIRGLMPAMTMPFKVDAATLNAAQKGQAITATLVRRDDSLWLEDVKPAAPAAAR